MSGKSSRKGCKFSSNFLQTLQNNATFRSSVEILTWRRQPSTIINNHVLLVKIEGPGAGLVYHLTSNKPVVFQGFLHPLYFHQPTNGKRTSMIINPKKTMAYGGKTKNHEPSPIGYHHFYICGMVTIPSHGWFIYDIVLPTLLTQKLI